jgi:hypothetical protein
MDDHKNRLSAMPIAAINKDEERQIQDLERKFGDKYILLAYEKMS